MHNHRLRFQSLLSLSNSLSDDLSNNGESTYGLSKKIGKTNITNAVISDPSGVQKHVSNLTGESKFGILGQEANVVQQETIYKMASKNIEQAPKDLVELANNNGGYDNITVVVIKNI